MSRKIACVFGFVFFFMAGAGARAESLFLAAPIAAYDINVIKVDTKYTIADVTNKIGKFTVTGTPTWLASSSNVITNGTFGITIFFDLTTGLPRFGDANKLEVKGTLAGVAQTFFLSTTLKLFGSGSEDTFDTVFKMNQGTVRPGSDIMSRIMGVSIPTFSDPIWTKSLAGAHVGDMIWDNSQTAGIEKGTANVWAPTPDAASGGLVLFVGLAAHFAFRRGTRQG